MKTIKKAWFFAIVLIGIIIIPTSGCNKEESENGHDEDENGQQTTVTDIDGNVYKTVKIGYQVWMAENLRTTKYNDGTPIPTGYTNDEWKVLRTEAYTIYPHSGIEGLSSEADVLEAYGALYNYYAVQTGKLCPKGWRLPTFAEWRTLSDYAGGLGVAGGKLKSTRTSPAAAHPRWLNPNTGATDEYGFSALPGGNRINDGSFSSVGRYGYWWSSITLDDFYAWSRSMGYDGKYMGQIINMKWEGLSVRCWKIN